MLKYSNLQFLDLLGYFIKRSLCSVVMIFTLLEYEIPITILLVVLLVYVHIIFFRIFTNAYMPVGFELAMELTFPAEETTTTGILMAMTQILGVLFAVGVGYLNLWIGCYWSLFSQGALLILGTVITGCIPNKLLRQEAFKQNPEIRKLSHLGSRLVFIE